MEICQSVISCCHLWINVKWVTLIFLSLCYSKFFRLSIVQWIHIPFIVRKKIDNKMMATLRLAHVLSGLWSIQLCSGWRWDAKVWRCGDRGQGRKVRTRRGDRWGRSGTGVSLRPPMPPWSPDIRTLVLNHLMSACGICLWLFSLQLSWDLPGPLDPRHESSGGPAEVRVEGRATQPPVGDFPWLLGPQACGRETSIIQRFKESARQPVSGPVFCSPLIGHDLWQPP